MSLQKAKVLSTEPLEIKDSKWVTLKKHTYLTASTTDKTSIYESAQRLTRPANSPIDGVGIVAILEPKDSPPLILLQKQFRPPIDKICIEVPAGLMDEGETAEECALRELKEETGYVGQICGGGFAGTGIMWNDPGFCNTNLRMIHVTIDLTNPPSNKNPTPNLEENEFIDNFTVPLRDLYRKCEELEAEGYAIDARVSTLAEGIEVARRWKIT
ncbi:hypothetical protein BLS_008655 [Venturia inaequalis]|uniref:Nudix hydrolase domain-containing protein n=1 Tax=Venturia inaequalis TaxID=5025 RepID=A0A8H3U6R8_VENIN|nr:hypothetical protein BLS_008655 [Venturia inaequalis]